MKAQRQPETTSSATKKVSKPTSNSSLTAATRTSKSAVPQSSEKVEDEVDTSNATTETAPQSTLNNYSAGLGMYGGGMMMPGMMGMGGMMGGYGMMGMGGMMGSQYFFSLNQFLFGVQSVIFSLGQAVQIVGMNAQQIKGVVASIRGMVENAMGSVREWSGLEWEEVVEGVLGEKRGDGAKRWMLGEENANASEGREQGIDVDQPLTENEIIRRRRLAALRWTMTLTISYAAYRSVRRLIRILLFGGDSNHRHSRNYTSHDSYHRGRYSDQYTMMNRRGGYHQFDGMNGYYGGSGMGYGSGYGGRYDAYGGSGYY